MATKILKKNIDYPVYEVGIKLKFASLLF